VNDVPGADDPILFLIQRGNDSLKSAEALVELDLILDGLSRAYYAALHHARALLLSIDIIPKGKCGTLPGNAPEMRDAPQFRWGTGGKFLKR